MFESSGTGVFDYALNNGSTTQVQWHFFDRTRLPVAVQTWELPPGGSEGMHAHPEGEPLEELYLVISGRAEMTVDGENYSLGPGDSVLARVDADHDLRNTGDEPLKVVVVWGRPGSAPYAPYDIADAARAARSATD